jgi:hypothetical protein
MLGIEHCMTVQVIRLETAKVLACTGKVLIRLDVEIFEKLEMQLRG